MTDHLKSHMYIVHLMTHQVVRHTTRHVRYMTHQVMRRMTHHHLMRHNDV